MRRVPTEDLKALKEKANAAKIRGQAGIVVPAEVVESLAKELLDQRYHW